MTKKVPFKNPYDLIKKLGKTANIILLVSGVFTLIIYFDGFGFPDSVDVITPFNIVLLALFSGFKIFLNYFYLRVERTRRVDFVDNSFGTQFSDENSEEYFTNENISPGLYKMGVNCFENCFHTHNTLKIMIKKKLVWTLVFVILFLGSAISGHNNIARLVFEIALPLVLIQEFITTCIYFFRIENVKEEFHSIFNNINLGSTKKSQQSKLLINILNYESALSWSSLPLDDLFHKYNDIISDKWNKTKEKLNIK